MKKEMKKFLSIITLSLIIAMEFIAIIPSEVFAASASTTTLPKLTYRAHVQNYGWMDSVTTGTKGTGNFVGTVGQSKRMEALKINFDAPEGVTLKYRAHVQDYGWMPWVTVKRKGNVDFAGTSGESKRVEAFQITVEGLDNYEIKYRVHAQDYGWMSWVTAGTSFSKTTTAKGTYAGTVGESKRMEAFEISIVPSKVESKVESVPQVPETPKATPNVNQKVENNKEETKPQAQETPKATPDTNAKVENNKEEVKPQVQEIPEVNPNTNPKVEDEKEEVKPQVQEMPEVTPSTEQKVEDKKEEIVPEEPKEQAPSGHIHTYTDWKVISEPTCAMAGVKERTCTTCNKVETQRIFEIVEHKLVRAESKDVAATCTEKGKVYSVCEVCGQEFFHLTQPLGHIWANEKTVDKKATCTNNGTKSIHCLRDGCTDTKEPELISAIGHNYTVTYTKATCVSDGMKIQTCKNCGDTIKTVTENAKGHKFGEFISDNNATCIKDGTKTKTCSECGNTVTITETGTKKGHHYELQDDKISPTCVKDGREASKKCTLCGDVIKGKTIKALGHNFVVMSSLSSESGGSSIKCSKCYADYTSGKVSFEKGHNWTTKRVGDKTITFCADCCDENGEPHNQDSKVWWHVWESENSKDRSGAIWFVGFTCSFDECKGFTNVYGNTVETVVEGRRGSTEEITMKAPDAKDGYRFDGWYDLSTGLKVTSSGNFTKANGNVITVHWRDMDKGFEARYVSM